MTEKQVHLNGKEQLWARGRVLGGSSSINGNVYVRGDPAEYDSWSSLGCPGGAGKTCCPISSGWRRFASGDPVKRGKSGPINVNQLKNFDKLGDAYLDASQEAGLNSSATIMTVTTRDRHIFNIRRRLAAFVAAARWDI